MRDRLAVAAITLLGPIGIVWAVGDARRGGRDKGGSRLAIAY